MVSIANPRQKRKKAKKTLSKSLNVANYDTHLKLITFALSSFSALGVLWLGVSFNTLANRPAPVLVQTMDGPMVVEAKDHLYRSPRQIQAFTQRTLTMLLSWNGQTVDEFGAIHKDKGVQVGKNSIPTLAYEASNAFAEDGQLRTNVLERLSKWVAPGYFNGTKEQRIKIGKISIPKEIEGKPGHWVVNVVATRYITVKADNKRQFEEPVRFNQTLYFRAVPPQTEPLPDTATPEEKAYYRIRQYGLEIYRMKKFDRGENI